MSDLSKTVGLAIGQARRRRGMSQADLGQQVGVTESQISDWEKGRNLPRLEPIIAIARALEVPIDQLVLGEEAFIRQMAQVATEEAKEAFEGRIQDLERRVEQLLGERPPR